MLLIFLMKNYYKVSLKEDKYTSNFFHIYDWIKVAV